MSYKISIGQTRLETREGQSEYVKIADTGGKDGGSEYGWVRKPNQQIEVQRDIYTQIVDELDLAAVISAVNKGAA